MDYKIKRFLALAIDSIISIFITTLIVVSVYKLTGNNLIDISNSRNGFIFNVLVYTVIITLFSIQEILYSKTIGKKIFKLKLVNKYGENINLRNAILRNMLRVIDYFMIGYLLVLLRKDNKRLGDIIAETKVVLEI